MLIYAHTVQKWGPTPSWPDKRATGWLVVARRCTSTNLGVFPRTRDPQYYKIRGMLVGGSSVVGDFCHGTKSGTQYLNFSANFCKCCSPTKTLTLPFPLTYLLCWNYRYNTSLLNDRQENSFPTWDSKGLINFKSKFLFWNWIDDIIVIESATMNCTTHSDTDN